MVEKVKRQYTSSLRREQAAATRTRIMEAAGALFMEKGYPGTTVREIAEAAGVAVDTVYAVFGNKVRVLTALVDRRLAPAGEESVLDRPEARAVRDERDQRRQISLFAQDVARISERVRPVFEVLRIAAAVEPDVAPVYREMEAQRSRNMGQFVEWLAAHGPLRLPAERATEVVWALASPDTARLLCDLGGWSTDEYAAWLDDSLRRLLLS